MKTLLVTIITLMFYLPALGAGNINLSFDAVQQPVQLFSPLSALDQILTVNVTNVPVTGSIAWMITSPVACYAYKCNDLVTPNRADDKKITISAGTPVIRGVGRNSDVTFVIFTGCTGALLERQ